MTEHEQGHFGSIGELNGKWSILFRFLLATGAIALPFLITLNVWFVKAIYDIKISQVQVVARFDAFIQQGPRYTPEMARSDNLELRESIIRDIKKDYPPDWLTRQVEINTRHIEELNEKMNGARANGIQ